MGTAVGTLARLWDGAVSLLLPARCVGCGAGGNYLCSACQAATPAVGLLPHEPGRFAFDAAVAAYAYTGAAREGVLRLKYRGLRAAAPDMAAALARAAAEAAVQADAVTPVPLHPKRLRSRGYNQAVLLARPLASALGVPVLEALARTGATGPQVEAGSRRARRANVAGAFAVRPGVDVAGLHVGLVDDVLTTGATLDAAATALKAAGAARVTALAFAHET
jgi:ComF family protein